MKEFIGTKGEWKVDGEPFFDTYSNLWKQKISYNDHFYQYVMGRTEEEVIANANLIAAAPLMLKALQSIAEYWNTPQKGNLSLNDHVEHSLKLAEEATNKALGL